MLGRQDQEAHGLVPKALDLAVARLDDKDPLLFVVPELKLSRNGSDSIDSSRSAPNLGTRRCVRGPRS
jgi:hypothetical protein